MLEQQRAHHRRERQRNEARYDHRARERQRELDKQAPGAARGKGERREHRRERQRHRDDREADLARADDGRLSARHPGFDMPPHIFEHDDRVIDDEADRQHQREQRQCIDRESERIHQAERADQRHRNSDDRNQRGTQAAQEEKDHEHDQRDRLADRLEHRLDRAIDEHRRVVRDDELHPLRKVLVHLVDFGTHGLRQLERIGDRLLDDADVKRWIAVVARDHSLIDRTDVGIADIAQPDRVSADVGDDDAVELFRRLQIRLSDDSELARVGFDSAGGNFGILPADRLFDVLHRQLVCSEPRAVDINAH